MSGRLLHLLHIRLMLLSRVEEILVRHGYAQMEPDLGTRIFTKDTGETQRLVSFQAIKRIGYVQLHSSVGLHVVPFECVWRDVRPKLYINHPIFDIISSNGGEEYYPLSFVKQDETETENYVLRITSLASRFPRSLPVLREQLSNGHLGEFRLSQFDLTNAKVRAFLEWLRTNSGDSAPN